MDDKDTSVKRLLVIACRLLSKRAGLKMKADEEKEWDREVARFLKEVTLGGYSEL